MSFFRKKDSKKNAVPQQAASVPSSVFASDRLAPVFQRMYIWVLSGSLNFNSYQVESGTPAFSGISFPIRGQYNHIISLISGALLPEYQERFLGTFDPPHLAQTFRSGRTGVSDVFCMAETEDDLPVSIQFRAERIPDANPENFAFLLYARRLQNEDDRGSSYHEPAPIEMLAPGEIDWKAVRSRRYSQLNSRMHYEYHIETDRLYLHTGQAEEASVRQLDRFIAMLESHSDHLLSHDSAAAMRTLLRNGISGIQGEAEIVFRTDGKRGSPFRHYQTSCLPLEEVGTPTWLFGSMQDVESEYKHRAVLEDSAKQIGIVVEKVFANLYLIDSEKNPLRFLMKTTEGFRASDTKYDFRGYFEQKILDGTIAESSAEEYRRLMQKGYLDHRVGSKPLSLSVQLRLSGAEEYRWYEDLICSIPGKPHNFILSRRDVSALHASRQREFEMEESLRMMEHCKTMLYAIAGLVEFRNIENGSHIYHVRSLTQIFLEDIARRSPQYNLTSDIIHLAVQAAAIHDIGKITIPDSILNKPAGLTEEEFRTMKTHTVAGAQIIENLNLPGQDALKTMCADVARHHHERWDGPEPAPEPFIPVEEEAA